MRNEVIGFPYLAFTRQAQSGGPFVNSGLEKIADHCTNGPKIFFQVSRKKQKGKEKKKGRWTKKKSKKGKLCYVKVPTFLFIDDHYSKKLCDLRLTISPQNLSSSLHVTGPFSGHVKKWLFLEQFSQNVFPGLSLAPEIKRFVPSLRELIPGSISKTD